jgi:phage terminase small subunit
METKLTLKQEKFVQEFLNPDGKGHHNATQAAIRAGYSKKNSRTIGYQLICGHVLITTW